MQLNQTGQMLWGMPLSPVLIEDAEAGGVLWVSVQPGLQYNSSQGHVVRSCLKNQKQPTAKKNYARWQKC